MKIFFLLITSLFILFSCVKNNPDPAWLEVNEWTLVDNNNPSSFTGELTHNFSNAWVYIDGEFIGTFEVPFKIPIIGEGEKEIIIYPTVLNNGIAATKKIYPFMVAHTESVNLVQNGTVTINPVTKYENSTTFWIEDFEGGDKLTESPFTEASLIKNNDPQYAEWGYYGQIYLSDAASKWLATSEGLDLPGGGAEVYLEIDYYNTNSLETGVISASPTDVTDHPNIRINAQDESEILWKKIYIQLKEIISSESTAEYFEQSFRAELDSVGTETMILIDNIKVVY